MARGTAYALLILVDQHSRADEKISKKKPIVLSGPRANVNNWDLVDLSAYFLVGPHVDPERPVLLKRLALSSNVWERRIAMVATFHFIKQGNPTPALSVAALLVGDRHDLIHKAVGWMLREVGKRCSVRAERDFLDAHAATCRAPCCGVRLNGFRRISADAIWPGERAIRAAFVVDFSLGLWYIRHSHAPTHSDGQRVFFHR
jgi:hypothetical protein